MRRLVPVALVLAVLASGGDSQNEVSTAYAIDKLHGLFGHTNPLGLLSNGSADEARFQQLIPAAYLPPAGGTLTAIEVSPYVANMSPILYQHLSISVGHSTLSSLSFSFAANLPKPIRVYTINSQFLWWQSRVFWDRITFDTPFLYDGKRNLILEFQKVIDRPNRPIIPTFSHQYNYQPKRTDLPAPVWVDGSYGSGAATAAMATQRQTDGPLLMRLIWTNTRSLTVTNTPVWPTYFRLGSTVILTARGQPGEIFFDAIDFGLRPTGFSVPGIAGHWWLPGLFRVFGMGQTDASGEGVVRLVIPNDPNLIGLHVYFQSATAGSRVYFTNVVDAIIAG